MGNVHIIHQTRGPHRSVLAMEPHPVKVMAPVNTPNAQQLLEESADFLSDTKIKYTILVSLLMTKVPILEIRGVVH